MKQCGRGIVCGINSATLVESGNAQNSSNDRKLEERVDRPDRRGNDGVPVEYSNDTNLTGRASVNDLLARVSVMENNWTVNECRTRES